MYWLGRLVRPTLGGRVLRAATCVARVARRLAGRAHRDSRAARAPTAVLHGSMASFTELHMRLGLLRCIRRMLQRTARVRHRPRARLPLRLGHRQPRRTPSRASGLYCPAWDAPAAPASTQLTPLFGARDQPPVTPLSALSSNCGHPPARLRPTPPPTPPPTDRVDATRLRCLAAPPDGKRRPARGVSVPEMRAPPQLPLSKAALAHCRPARRLDTAPPSHQPPPRRAAGRRAPSAPATAHADQCEPEPTKLVRQARIALVATVPARAGRWQPFWERLCASPRPACASTTQPGMRGGRRRGGPVQGARRGSHM